MTPEESKSFWKTLDEAAAYYESWPKCKKEGYEPEEEVKDGKKQKVEKTKT